MLVTLFSLVCATGAPSLASPGPKSPGGGWGPSKGNPPQTEDAGPPRLPTTGAWFGASANKLGADDNEGATELFEGLIERKLAVKRVYYSWDEMFPTDLEYWLRDRGTIPIVSWTTSLNNEPIVTWADVAAGRHDADIDARATGIKAYGSPMFFAFHHEPEGEDDPDDFVAAYRRIHDRFVAKGVTNVSYAWVLMDYTFRIGPAAADQWYPGDSYVDIIGSDQFNWYECPGHEAPWNDFRSLAQPFYDYGVDKGKPMMLAEWASSEDYGFLGRKAEWITEAAATLKTWPQIKVVAWYQYGAGEEVCGLLVETSETSLAAFIAMGADPYYNPPPPLVNIDSRPPDLHNSTSATFRFHSNILTSTFTCKLDTGTTKTCLSPYTVSSLSQGDHTMKITATDLLSGQSSYEIVPWSVDSVKPVDTLVNSPESPTRSTQATFQQTTSEPGSQAVFTCKLDAAPQETCEMIKVYFGLANGVHTFTGTVTDAAGNVSVPVTHTWTVDTVAPTTTITSGPPNPSDSNDATFAFTSEPSVRFKCSMDNGTFISCSTGKQYWSLSEGSHTFKVRATDVAGNTGPSVKWTWVVDARGPDMTIMSGPLDLAWSGSATFRFSANRPGVTFMCTLDSNRPTNCSSGLVYANLSAGDHRFEVYATDSAGRIGRVSSWRWTVR